MFLALKRKTEKGRSEELLEHENHLQNKIQFPRPTLKHLNSSASSQ